MVLDGLDLHEEGPFGNSLLRNAATQDSPAALRMLLDLGANPNHKTNYRSPVDKRFEAGFTPLMYVHTLEAAQLLTEHGADVNLASDAGTTPLMRARSAEIARLLVESGADVDSTNPSGSTALLFAVQMGRPDVVEYLLSVGADPNARQSYRRGKKTYTPLRLAREGIDAWSKHSPEALGSGGVAILESHRRIVDLLVAEGAV
jgi:ankyrin repeat protein